MADYSNRFQFNINAPPGAAPAAPPAETPSVEAGVKPAEDAKQAQPAAAPDASAPSGPSVSVEIPPVAADPVVLLEPEPESEDGPEAEGVDLSKSNARDMPYPVVPGPPKDADKPSLRDMVESLHASDAKPADRKRSGRMNSDGSRNPALEADLKSCRVDLPLSIIKEAQFAIKNARNRSDAVAAYLYVTMDRVPEVPEAIKALAADYRDDGGLADLEQQIEDLLVQNRSFARQMKSMASVLNQLQMAMIWMVGERLGLDSYVKRQEPETMQYVPPEFETLLHRLQMQSKQREERLQAAEGRKIGEAAMKKRNGGK